MVEFILGLIIGGVIGISGTAFILLSLFDRDDSDDEEDTDD